MAQIKPELKTILDRYGIDPRDQSQCWDCRGTIVLYHKAFEIIAAKEAISFDPPQIVRCDKTEAVVCVTGRMKDRAEWSFGEAVIGQNYQVSGKQAAYPWAMAEKRAKDRVIAKLVGLAAYVYSEDEADDFKNAKPAGDSTPADRGGNPASPPSAPPAPPKSGPALVGDDPLSIYRIPVPIKNNASDWDAWVPLFGGQIKAAQAKDVILALQEANAAALDNLSRSGARGEKTHAALMSAISARVTTLGRDGRNVLDAA